MLPAAARMRRRAAFLATTRAGRRAAVPAVVVHLQPGVLDNGEREVGFIVSRSIGPAVTRNRVRRRLRHIVRDRLDRVPPGARLVVRANPSAAVADHRELAGQVDRALDRLTAARGTGS